MDAGKLSDGHLPVFEAGAFDLLFQGAHHECVIESLLLGKSGDVDRLKACQGLPVVLYVVGDGLVGKIGEAIVVAVVANVGGELGRSAHGVLPLFVEETIEVGAAGVQALAGSRYY